MKKLLPLGMVLAVSSILSLMTVAHVSAQSAKKEGSAKKEKEQSFAQEFWKWLDKVEYKESFSPWPGMKDEFLPGKSPHGAFLKVYVNRPVVQNPDDPPHKSVIVKENYIEDEQTKEKKLVAITPMYRVKKGYDPENNDWYWVKYLPDGKVAKTDDGMPIAGKVKSCIECHASAAGDDYIFTNDE